MSFKPYTEKKTRKKLEYVRFRSDPDPDQNETDPKHCFFEWSNFKIGPLIPNCA